MIDLRIDLVTCPGCGSEVEIFTDEYDARCPNCGRVVLRQLASCIDYCPNAQRCLQERRRKQAKLEFTSQAEEPLLKR